MKSEPGVEEAQKPSFLDAIVGSTPVYGTIRQFAQIVLNDQYALEAGHSSHPFRSTGTGRFYPFAVIESQRPI